MSTVRADCFAVSLDGYGAGPRQSLENPLGEGGTSNCASVAILPSRYFSLSTS